jgi:hypothetical protein
MLSIEQLIDDLEYKVVLCLGIRTERISYWKRTREIRRGCLLKLYLDD